MIVRYYLIEMTGGAAVWFQTEKTAVDSGCCQHYYADYLKCAAQCD